ncbi:MAG: sulfatase-like hydrolase/transferase [Bacteroidota bacterium]|nr:sulfatase-like hydrolase/transferase [Bacteroidota bacterium]
MVEKLKNYVLYRSHPFVLMNVATLLLFMCLQCFEFVTVVGAHAVVGFSFSLLITTVLNDLIIFFFLMALLTPVYFFIHHYSKKSADIVQGIFLLALLVLTFGLGKYFSTTSMPLSADFYGYSWRDIQETVLSSGGVDTEGIVVILLLLFVFLSLPFVIRTLPSPKFILSGFYLFTILSIPLAFIAKPQRQHYASDIEYYVAINKTSFFLEKSVWYFSQKIFSGGSFSKIEYPLLHPANYQDVLGKFLTHSSAPPNLVFVMVEGLGSDFVNGGVYSGFTPFFDSLSQRNLFWKNFLSTTGRTFGVLPSMFGSLPYGEKGFLEMGAEMPAHMTSISLLKNNGYHTSYYYGGDASFDLQNIFLEYQKIDQIIDQQHFTSRYQKEAPAENGFSWGYADRDVFQRSLEIINEQRHQQRLDIYMTLSTHEPFLPPQKEYYLNLFYARLSTLDIPDERKEWMKKYDLVFASLLYMDDALRYLFTEYQHRAEYQKTIFFITGDHRLIPVPPGTTLDRFRVPFVIASPMVKEARTFLSVSSHADVTPSLLAFLKMNYVMNFPEKVHWLGSGIDTAMEFRNIHSTPLMRNKNELIDYIDKDFYLADNRLFHINEKMYITADSSDTLRMVLTKKLQDFKSINAYVCQHDKLYPFSENKTLYVETINDDSIFQSLNVQHLSTDQLFERARRLAFEGKFIEARVVCRNLLAVSPKYHDVRTLYGRTFAWGHDYDNARKQFQEVIRSAPEYADAYFGLAQIDYWSSNNDTALASINVALKLMPNVVDRMLLKSKILRAMERENDALQELDAIERIDPSNSEAVQLRTKLAAIKK